MQYHGEEANLNDRIAPNCQLVVIVGYWGDSVIRIWLSNDCIGILLGTKWKKSLEGKTSIKKAICNSIAYMNIIKASSSTFSSYLSGGVGLESSFLLNIFGALVVFFLPWPPLINLMKFSFDYPTISSPWVNPWTTWLRKLMLSLTESPPSCPPHLHPLHHHFRRYLQANIAWN